VPSEHRASRRNGVRHAAITSAVLLVPWQSNCASQPGKHQAPAQLPILRRSAAAGASDPLAGRSCAWGGDPGQARQSSLPSEAVPNKAARCARPLRWEARPARAGQAPRSPPISWLTRSRNRCRTCRLPRRSIAVQAGIAACCHEPEGAGM